MILIPDSTVEVVTINKQLGKDDKKNNAVLM